MKRAILIGAAAAVAAVLAGCNDNRALGTERDRNTTSDTPRGRDVDMQHMQQTENPNGAMTPQGANGQPYGADTANGQPYGADTANGANGANGMNANGMNANGTNGANGAANPLGSSSGQGSATGTSAPAGGVVDGEDLRNVPDWSGQELWAPGNGQSNGTQQNPNGATQGQTGSMQGQKGAGSATPQGHTGAGTTPGQSGSMQNRGTMNNGTPSTQRSGRTGTSNGVTPVPSSSTNGTSR